MPTEPSTRKDQPHMISRKRKGKGRVKTVVDFGMLDDNTVCCGCKGGADCPLRKALNLYRDESKKGGAR